MTTLIQTQTEEFTANRSALSIRPPGATLVVPPNPVFVNIKPSHLEALQALGYTESEARFLYIVATHSGYFVARQFLAFTSGHWGKRTTPFWSKLHTKKHARTEYFPKSGKVYHVFSRRLYGQIGRENLRNRREHEIEFIQRRIGILDFVLSHPQSEYLETEPEKVSYFCDQLKVPMLFGSDASSPLPVVTFTYLQGAEASLTEFVHHLRAYIPLFRQLSEFRFLYLARIYSHFEKAKELFDSVVTIPFGSDVLTELCRYFQIRQAWDLKRYTSVTEGDLIFRNQAKSRFAGERFEHLYRRWKAGRVTEADIRQELGGANHPVPTHFRTELLRRTGALERDP